MKRSYKKLLYIALSGLLCTFTVFSAEAQRGARSAGGGGGGMRGGGGGGGSISRPSYGGGSSGMSRPSFGGSNTRPSFGSGNNSSISRPSYGNVPRNYSPGTRPSVSGSNRYNGISPNSVGRYNGYNNGSRYNYNNGRVYRNPGYYRPGYGNRYYSNGRYYYRPNYYGRYYGNRGFYYPYRGFYNSYYMPYIGFNIGVLPYGYYPFYWNNVQYYYSDGLYYQQQDDQYTVVEPPVGAEIKQLPEKAQSIVINGVQYYELNGVYYQPVTKDDGTVTYQIAGKDGELNTEEGYDEQMPLVGDISIELPQGSRKVTLNGEKLFIAPDGVYYKEDKDANDNKVYKVVGVPSPDGKQADDDDEDDN